MGLHSTVGSHVAISASGALRRRGGDLVMNDGGEHRHGMPGDRFVLGQTPWNVR